MNRTDYSHFSRNQQILGLALSLFLISLPVAGQDAGTEYQKLFSKYRGGDPYADLEAFPTAPEGFEVTLVASEPVVRNPVSMAFDQRGRLFIGQGPQWRRMEENSPKDSVVRLVDDDGDGVADRTQTFATGFNSIQGLAWLGDDLYVANAPDFTIVRDLDGDDVADEYVRLYTDLGNLEHSLHGLNFAPDGRLYMSKGNSRGLIKPGRVAPKPFRELASWATELDDGLPDFPEPEVFTAETYQANFHNPNDDWGRHGGILRSQPDGSQLEIVARGFRNPWDIAFSETFDWMGADQDQTAGDKFYMPFKGAHMGWNHAWSSHWAGEDHLPTAPTMNYHVDGSTTGVLHHRGNGFPEKYRGFFVGDWLRKVVYLVRPEWDGARMAIEGGKPVDLFSGGKSLFRPTDIAVGPDGALYVLSWGTSYGSEWKDGEFVSAGRVWRFAWQPTEDDRHALAEIEPLGADATFDELVADLDHELPVRSADASKELVSRGSLDELQRWLDDGNGTTAQETWALWTIGRFGLGNLQIDEWLAARALDNGKEDFNTRLQAIRILGYRSTLAKRPVSPVVIKALEDSEPRIRHAAVTAIFETMDTSAADSLIKLAKRERDDVVFYTNWQALANLLGGEELTRLLQDKHPRVRLSALLASLEKRLIGTDGVLPLLDDSEVEVAAVARSFLEKAGAIEPLEEQGKESLFNGLPFSSFVSNISAASGRRYQMGREAVAVGAQLYTDSGTTVMRYPEELEGAFYLQTANADRNSSGEGFLSFDLPEASEVFVAHDLRVRNRPDWLVDGFEQLEKRFFRSTAQSYSVWKASFPAGTVTLGGNTRDGTAADPLNYIVLARPRPPQSPSEATTREAAIAKLPEGDAARGEWLFLSQSGPACWSCHAIDDQGRAFGPDLTTIGDRDNPLHWIESILEPNAVVMEGFAAQRVATKDGTVHVGSLVEESGLQLSLRNVVGELIRVPQSEIAEKESLHTSLMPSFAGLLGPRDVADLVAYMATLTSSRANAIAAEGPFSFEKNETELRIALGGQPIATYSFADPRVGRPFFYDVYSKEGVMVTRNFPPVEGTDPVDHEFMHPGLWIAYGDINGQDYWRNKATVEFKEFVEEPHVEGGDLRFAVKYEMNITDGAVIGAQISRFAFTPHDRGYFITWEEEYFPSKEPLVFGDYEEMGLGVRVTTPMIEKNGGLIRNSEGGQSAQETFAKEAVWSDYAAKLGDRWAGVTLMADPSYFRGSYWHNRDYGLLLANPFGRKAYLRIPERRPTRVEVGESLTLRFGVLVHSGDSMTNVDSINAAYERFLRSMDH